MRPRARSRCRSPSSGGVAVSKKQSKASRLTAPLQTPRTLRRHAALVDDEDRPHLIGAVVELTAEHIEARHARLVDRRLLARVQRTSREAARANRSAGG